jgi:flagellar hook-associated protein 3 FlgL
LLDNLSNQVSDFGARANRIEVQSSLYLNLELAAKENLSGKEDTDMLKAIMELNGKKTAYEAALSAAAQTMQLSLVNFLR